MVGHALEKLEPFNATAGEIAISARHARVAADRAALVAAAPARVDPPPRIELVMRRPDRGLIGCGMVFRANRPVVTKSTLWLASPPVYYARIGVS